VIPTARPPSGRLERWRFDALDLAADLRDRVGPSHPGLRCVVTGSPRSGTSFLTGLIHRLGLRCGPRRWLKPADAHNRFGYYECVPLKSIEKKALDRLGVTFHEPTGLTPGWTRRTPDLQRRVARIVRTGRIDLYKGNRLVVLAELIDTLYPEARWVFIHRDSDESFRSRFGEEMTRDQWRAVTERRMSVWRASGPAEHALYLDYDDFRANLDQTIDRLAAHLDLRPTGRQRRAARAFFQPRPSRRAA